MADTEEPQVASRTQTAFNPSLYSRGGTLTMTVNPVVNTGTDVIRGEDARSMLQLEGLTLPEEGEEEVTVLSIARSLKSEDETAEQCKAAIKAWKAGIKLLKKASDSGAETLQLSAQAAAVVQGHNYQGIKLIVTQTLSDQHQAALDYLIDAEKSERESILSGHDSSAQGLSSMSVALKAISERYSSTARGTEPIARFVQSLLKSRADKETDAFKTAENNLQSIAERGLRASDQVSHQSGGSSDVTSVDQALSTAEGLRKYLQDLQQAREAQGTE